MNDRQSNKQKILIVDDSEMNRSILADMLGDEYDIMEVENGLQAVAALQRYENEISLVLLDIVMPEMDGFGVLAAMNQYHWIEDIPVIMISAESGSRQVKRAYKLGVTDFIGRPFDALIVHHRVVNTILLYAKQKKLIGLVADQIYEKQRQSSQMIDILSHIVEFRNGESGQHVLHVRILTELLLRHLLQKTDRYRLTQEDISIISTASALHDIGKIAIDERILNKPGRLTPEEFTIMKTHSAIGAEMLENLKHYQGDPLVMRAREICRWHHERWDGRGYPDGLKEDEIPISAQIVALADVYDALTSTRVYKPAFSHERAVEMILNGECGTFNPLLMECLRDIAEVLPKELEQANSAPEQREMRSAAQEMLRHEELTASERSLRLLEHERMKYSFFAAMSREIQFEYTLSPPSVMLNAWGADKLGLDEIVMDPLHDPRLMDTLDLENMGSLANLLHSTTPEKPMVSYDCQVLFTKEQEKRWVRIAARATWSTDEPPRYTGAIGKAIDIHESRMQLNNLERLASHDAMTGLLNRTYAQKRIQERLDSRPIGSFALVLFDLDNFKRANDTFGHAFGDQVLIHTAEMLRQSIRSGDIVARAGGDEFMIFLEYKDDLEPIISRIFDTLCGNYGEFVITVSMGVAQTSVVGRDYDALFKAADKALYNVKRDGKAQYCLYDKSMQNMFSVLSPIDQVPGEDNTKKGEDYI